MKRYTKIAGPLFLSAALVQLSACGGGGGGSKSGQKDSSPRVLEAEAEGTYVADLEPMNNGVGGALSAIASITKEGSKIIGYVRLNGGYPRTSHQQRVHVGTSCPTMAQDTNGDGYVDVNEAYAHVGKILFPLDADISSQERGSSLWPMGDIYGYYHWERATSYDRFISDLREADLSGDSDYAKLGADGDLNLDGRVVMIHGTAEISNLPDSVGTRGRLRNFQVIPIACGKFRKITNIPGVIEEDVSLGRAGEGETVGGSSGADDGATVPVNGEYRPGPREEEETTGAAGGGTSGGATSGGRTSGETAGGSTSGGSTTGGESTGSTTGGETGTPNYGDDDH